MKEYVRIRFLCALYSILAGENLVTEKLRVLVILLHRDRRVGEFRVTMVQSRLPGSRSALCA